MLWEELKKLLKPNEKTTSLRCVPCRSRDLEPCSWEARCKRGMSCLRVVEVVVVLFFLAKQAWWLPRCKDKEERGFIQSITQSPTGQPPAGQSPNNLVDCLWENIVTWLWYSRDSTVLVGWLCTRGTINESKASSKHQMRDRCKTVAKLGYQPVQGSAISKSKDFFDAISRLSELWHHLSYPFRKDKGLIRRPACFLVFIGTLRSLFNSTNCYTTQKPFSEVRLGAMKSTWHYKSWPIRRAWRENRRLKATAIMHLGCGLIDLRDNGGITGGVCFTYLSY